MQKSIKKIVLFVIAIAGLFVVSANAMVLESARGRVYAGNAADIPHRDVAIIFGGGVINNAFVVAMAKNRMDRGIALYKDGIVKNIFLTGDDGSYRVDEVDGMRRYAIAQGVATSSIGVDPYGYRTYDSCYRARRMFGIRRAIVVSQSFHLPRILYLCRAFGIDAIGVPSQLDGKFMAHERTMIREFFARAKAVIDVWILHPRVHI